LTKKVITMYLIGIALTLKDGLRLRTSDIKMKEATNRPNNNIKYRNHNQDTSETLKKPELDATYLDCCHIYVLRTLTFNFPGSSAQSCHYKMCCTVIFCLITIIFIITIKLF